MSLGNPDRPFYFTAEARVDFRELVRELASQLHCRIDMRQIGPRDEAKLLGGYGTCGRPLCCTTWLQRFEPISIKMAKRQHLSLNPSRLSGLCGRLKCCLRYELPNAKGEQFAGSRAWVLAGCRRLPGSKRRFQCRCRRDPSGCRLGEANQDAVFQRDIMGRGEGGPRIEAHGPAARKEAMACVSALPIDRRRPYRRRRPGARIQTG